MSRNSFGVAISLILCIGHWMCVIRLSACIQKLQRAARPVFNIEAKQVSTIDIDIMKPTEVKEPEATDELNDSDAQRRNLLEGKEDDPNETNTSVL